MTSHPSKSPLWTAAHEVRNAVDPSTLGSHVVHYSIPSIDEFGTGQIEESDSINSAKLALGGGEILISKLNPRKSRVVHVRHEKFPAVASTEFVALQPFHGTNSRFLAYALESEIVRQELDSRVQSVTRSHQRVTPGDITHLSIWVPDATEQRRIADFLDAETARINRFGDANDRLLALLAERRTAAVIDEVSGGRHPHKRPSTLAWLTHVPESWDEVRVGLLARMGSGHTPSRSRSDWWRDCTIPWITTGEVQQVRDDRAETIYETREKISELGLQNSAAELHPKGTVVLLRQL